MNKKLDDNQTREQAGFQAGFSTLDHIHVLNQIKEKYRNYKLPLCLIFVDFEKAFDSVEIDAILKSLLQQGIEEQYIKLLKDIYSECTPTVHLKNEGIRIHINKGVRQGDTISPKLFTSCLEQIFHSINWENKGVNVNGEMLNHLKFADDIVLIATSWKDAEEMLEDLQCESEKVGLKINISKTKRMSNKANVYYLQ